MIPPRKAEGEVDLKRPSGVWGELSQLSSLLCCGAAPPEAGWQQFGCSKAERTKSPHKAGYGRWRQDFIFFPPLQEEGERFGRSLQGGQPLKIIPRTVWRGTQSGPECLSPSSSAQSWQNIHLLHQQVVLMQEFTPPCTNTHVHTAHFQM